MTSIYHVKITCCDNAHFDLVHEDFGRKDFSFGTKFKVQI